MSILLFQVPFKDDFWSEETQPGNRWGTNTAREADAELQTVVSALTAGEMRGRGREGRGRGREGREKRKRATSDNGHKPATEAEPCRKGDDRVVVAVQEVQGFLLVHRWDMLV